MTFKELSKVCKEITCYHMRSYAEIENEDFFKIVVSNFHEDKEREFLGDGERGMFSLVDERIMPNKALETMDINTVVEIVRNMMLVLYMHEFNEFFKFKKKTVTSPHLNLINNK